MVADTIKVRKNAVFKAVVHILKTLQLAKKTINKTNPFVQCVKDVVPPIDNTNDSAKLRIWKERGVHLKVSKIAEIPSHLVKSLLDILGGALPPPPTAVYSRNVILTNMGPGFCIINYVLVCSTPKLTFQCYSLNHGMSTSTL